MVLCLMVGYGTALSSLDIVLLPRLKALHHHLLSGISPLIYLARQIMLSLLSPARDITARGSKHYSGR